MFPSSRPFYPTCSKAYAHPPSRTSWAWIINLGLLFAPSLAHAQTGGITGVISDQRAAPLAFSSVVLVDRGTGTVANAQGAYRLEGLEPGNYSVRVSCVGYAARTFTATVRAGANIVADQRLDESVVDLQAFAVVGTITGGSGPSRERAGSAWYVGPREIQAQAATDVHRLLRSVPGVNIQEEDGFGLRPNIGLRGAGSARTSKITLMEDGVLIAPAPYAQPAAYFFPTVGRMHAVEVVKGSSQIQYGPLTTGGAVNLISTPVPARDQAMVALWGGSFGSRVLHANAGTTMGGHQMLVETFQQAADGFKLLDDGGNTGFNKQDYLAKWQWSTADSLRVRQAVAVKAGYTREVSNETYLGLTDGDFGANPYRRYAGSASDRMEMEHDLFSIRYSAALKNGPEMVATVYRTNTYRNWYKLDQVVDSSGARIPISDLLEVPDDHAYAMEIVRGGTSADDALLVKANNRNYQSSGAQLVLTHKVERERVTHGMQVGVRLHSDYMDRFQWTDKWRIQEGTMLQTEAGVPGTESNRLVKADAVAAHALYDIDFGKLALHPGVRFEHMDFQQDDYGKVDPARNGTALVITRNTVEAWSPGLSADYAMNKALSVFAGVHKGSSPPGAQPGVEPESSINYESGLRVDAKGWDVQLMGFRTDYSQMLGSDLAAGGGSGSGDQFNAGQALVQGVELYMGRDVLRGFSERLRLPVSIAYTYTDARFGSSFNSSFEPWGEVNEGDRMPYAPEHQINVRVAMEARRFGAGINVNYQGSTATVTGAENDAPSTVLPARTVIDANASWRFSARCEAFATVTNLADAVYLASRLPAGARPGMPRSVQGGLRFRF